MERATDHWHVAGHQEVTGPALQGVLRVSMWLAVAMRLTSAVVGSFVAVFGAGPPARRSWVLFAVTLLLAWALVFTYVAVKHGLSGRLITVEILGIAVICLAQGYLLPATTLESQAGTGWVALVASIGVLGAQLGLRLGPGTLMAASVAVAYGAGRSSFTEMPAVLVLQGLVAGCIMTLLRRAARDADTALDARTNADIAASCREAVRADERDQQRKLHDTVLATLTMVGTGAITRSSPALRGRAAEDLAVLNRLRSRPERADEFEHASASEQPPARMDVALQTLQALPHPGLPQLDIRIDIPPIELPRDVMSAVVDSVVEALTNVARHAGTTSVEVRARYHRNGVAVEISDSGRGFDIHRIPPERRGWRESIAGRMREVGGSASILSHAGKGTRVTLRWNRE